VTVLILLTGFNALYAAETLSYYHNDHLGTPQSLTDENQGIVWQAHYDPFGKAVITTETVSNNLRFPGQYFDGETGLHYNYFRYYDPSTGRYITSDPIGLAGGLNTYVYTAGNPLTRIDPTGNIWWFVPALVEGGVAVGGGLTAGQAIVGGLLTGVVLSIPSDSIPRPPEMTSLEERQYDRHCSNTNDPCKDLKAAAQAAINMARIKMRNLLLDKGKLFGSIRWTNHIDDLQGRFASIAAMISLGKTLGCDMTSETIAFSTLYIPSSPL
jgi:RHS repeat-associated protein